jgi:hypothetical protein
MQVGIVLIEEVTMRSRIVHALSVFTLILLLVSCNMAVVPRTNGVPSLSPATFTKTIPPTPVPSPTATRTSIPPTVTTAPSSTSKYLPLSTLAATPTPNPGWVTYTNDYLGYGINHPSWAKMYESGPEGMETNEVVPPGFTFNDYFDYVMAILPDNLCVSIGISNALVTIVPPYPIVTYGIPCPGMGIGDQYTIEQAEETLSIAGRQYHASYGGKLYLKSTGAFYGEYYFFDLENGFRVVYNGGPREDLSLDNYLTQRATAMEMISTLHWFRTPDLTKPGTTCAGKFTHLMPGTYAVVTGSLNDPPNRVRSGPSTSSEIITQIYPQTVVKIEEGPVCVDELVFWRVTNSLIPGGSGWTAEGDGINYWLEPIKP